MQHQKGDNLQSRSCQSLIWAMGVQMADNGAFDITTSV